MVRPMANKVIAITRAGHDAEEFVSIVKGMGATPVLLPTIEIVPTDEGKGIIQLMQAKHYDYCAFLSPKAVRVFFQTTSPHDPSNILSLLKGTTILAIGPKTSEELSKFGLFARTPSNFSSAGLVEMLSMGSPQGKKILIPRSEESSASEHECQLADILAESGMVVDQVYLYRIKAASPSDQWQEFAKLLRAKRIDSIIFTSASSVRAFIDILSKVDQTLESADKYTRVISIGPMTSSELRSSGMNFTEALEHTIPGAVERAVSAMLSGQY